jgi:hypothetical protein
MPGDWCCPNRDCGHFNSAKRSECQVCLLYRNGNRSYLQVIPTPCRVLLIFHLCSPIHKVVWSPALPLLPFSPPPSFVKGMLQTANASAQKYFFSKISRRSLFSKKYYVSAKTSTLSAEWSANSAMHLGRPTLLRPTSCRWQHQLCSQNHPERPKKVMMSRGDWTCPSCRLMKCARFVNCVLWLSVCRVVKAEAQSAEKHSALVPPTLI